MLLSVRTAPGSIREQNQDYVLSNEENGIVILANGFGLFGREAAEFAAKNLLEALCKIRIQASVESSNERIGKAIDDVFQKINELKVNSPGFQNVRVDLAISCIVEGQLFLAVTNTSGIIASIGRKLIRLEPVGLPKIIFNQDTGSVITVTEPATECSVKVVGPFPITVGDWFMALSEGLLVSQSLEELELIVSNIMLDSESVIDMIFARASQRYDGDDRTLVFGRFLPHDLKKTLSNDETIVTHFDRTFKIPIWLAGLAFIFVGLITIWLRKFDLFED